MTCDSKKRSQEPDYFLLPFHLEMSFNPPYSCKEVCIRSSPKDGRKTWHSVTALGLGSGLGMTQIEHIKLVSEETSSAGISKL